MKLGLFKLDGWTPIHLMMGLGVALIVRSLGGDRWMAFGVGVLMCVAWEALDSQFAGKWFFDSRGGDVIDVLVGAVGAGIAVIIT
jgi:VanZ family protein